MANRLAVPPGAIGVLRGLLAQLVALHDEPSEDHPAWQRLYPSATRDPRLDRDLRALIHPDLVDGRRAGFDRVLALLEPLDDDATVLVVDDDGAVALLGVVNDIRISLAAMIDLPGRLDDTGRLPESTPDTVLGTVELIEWLALLQEQVLSTIAPESQEHFDDPIHDRLDPPDPDIDPDTSPEPTLD